MSFPTSTSSRVSSWFQHIRVLAVEIGPRGSTRAGERLGAEYAQQQLSRLGLQPAWESFKSARSIFVPHLIGSLLMLAAFMIYPLQGSTTAIVAALLSILVLVTELQELGFQNNLIRWILPKAESQNVHAVIPPSGEHRQDLILVGHLDTQRTPFIFRSPAHVKAYNYIILAVFAAFILQALVYTLSIFFAWPWSWYATFPSAFCALLLSAICIEADSTPFTAGANDNASAVGLVLALSEHFSSKPLLHTRLFMVCTGCEEVQHYGMNNFYANHRAELKNPKAVVFEMLGCAGPAWLTSEGIIVPFKADLHLAALVERLSAEHPEWCAYPVKISGGNTEMADALRNKIPAITITGTRRDGVSPYWHQKSDTFDKLDLQAMERAWALSTTLINSIDQLE